MRNRFVGLFALSVAVMLVSAACSVRSVQDDPVVLPGVEAAEAEEPSLPASVDRVVDVELSDFAIAVDSFDFIPGETVQFVVANAGVVAHEFRLSNQDRVDEAIEGGVDVPATIADEGEPEDAILLLTGGESGTMTFTFPDNAEDYTVAVCLVPGHYDAGMATDLPYGT